MMVLVTYDVNTETAAGKKRLIFVAKTCVESIIDYEKDSLRYYCLGSNWQRRVEHIGAKETYNPEGTLTI